MQLIERYKGALLGLAAGDALGTTLVYHALLCARPPADPRQPDAACVTDSLTLTWAE